MQVEKYIPTRINKDNNPRDEDRGSARKFLPGDMLDALNCRMYSSQEGSYGGVENIKGNVLKNFPLPDGENKAIGWFLNNKENTFIYHVYNSLGNHQVIEYIPLTESFNVLLSGPSLNYSLSNYIASGGVIDDLHLWNDGINPSRVINIISARSGQYVAPYSGPQITLVKAPPTTTIVHSKSTDSSIQSNYVNSNNWQFAFRYIYPDNLVSVLSPISKSSFGAIFPDPFDNTDNQIDLVLTVDDFAINQVERIEILYRKGNKESFFIFETIDNPSESIYNISFKNDVSATPVSDDEAFIPFDILPENTPSLELMENRIVSVIPNSGFDVDVSSFSLNLTIEEIDKVGGFPGDQFEIFQFAGVVRSHKDNGIYSVGIRFFDDFGRASFVKKKTDITIPFNPAEISYDENLLRTDARKTLSRINWSLSGSPPSGFSKYQICITQEQFYESYFQTAGNLLFYISEERESGSRFGYEVLVNGRLFYDNIISDGNALNESTRLYIQIPDNIPFVVDESYFIRILNPEWTVERVFKLIDVIENYLVIDFPFPRNLDFLIDITTYNLSNDVRIEVFKPRQDRDNIFYGITPLYNIDSGSFTESSGVLDGDTHNISTILSHNASLKESNVDTDIRNNPIFFEDRYIGVNEGAFIESPTTIHSQIEEDTIVQLTGIQQVNPGDAEAFFGEPPNTELGKGYVLDYTKTDTDNGKVTTTNEDEKKLFQPTTVGFSDIYIQNSFVNGLNRFRSANQYNIPADRSPITSLIKANDILLAIHERETSSVYIGEGLIREGENFVLAKTENFIGDDRELEFSYGTINPESVIEVYGRVYFWDAHKGCVVRYTKAGLFPISSYKMTNYFYDKAKRYSPYKYDIKIVTGYDYFANELLITFPAIIEDGIQEETWAFNTIEEVWTTRWSFIPDYYGYLNNRLYTFKNGALWEHEANGLYNNFYGNQYNREFKIVCNPAPGTIKRYFNVHLDCHYIMNDNEDLKVVEIWTRDRDEQYSYIPAYEFSFDENKWYAPILRDVNTLPELIESGRIALRDGDQIRSASAEILVRTDRIDKNHLHHVNVVFTQEDYSV